MNRLLSILVSLFVLFLIYLWINHIMTSPPHSEIEDQTTARVIDDSEKAEILDEYNIDEAASEKNNSTAASAPENTDANAEPSGTTAADTAVDTAATTKRAGDPGQDEPEDTDPGTEAASDPEPADPEPEEPPVTPTPPRETASSAASDGIHMVIAGNFLERKNAEKRVQQLKENGFPNAEVVNFQLSQYHTVSAGRYNDISDARKLRQRLRAELNIEAYVRHGN